MIKKISVAFLGLLIVLFLPVSTTHAQKPLPPIDIDLILEESQPKPGSFSYLILNVTPQINIPKASVEFKLPEEINLIHGETTWNGPLDKGATREFRVYVEIAQKGEYSVTASVSCIDEKFPFGRQAYLNIITSPEEALVSSDPFILMKLKMAKTSEERENLLKAKAIEISLFTPREMTSGEKALDTVIQKMCKEKNKEVGINSSPQSVTRGKFTVKGKATYKDSDGNSHPIRYAKVEVYKSDRTQLDDKKRSTWADGTFSVPISAEAGDTVYVDVITETLSDLAARVEMSSGDVYSMRSSINTIPDS